MLVKLFIPWWDRLKLRAALAQCTHQSEEFVDMIHKRQWAVLPVTMALELDGIHVSLLCNIPQIDWSPFWIYDHI